MRQRPRDSGQSINKGTADEVRTVGHIARRAHEWHWVCGAEACVWALELSGWRVRRFERTRDTWADGVSRCHWCQKWVDWPTEDDR